MEPKIIGGQKLTHYLKRDLKVKIDKTLHITLKVTVIRSQKTVIRCHFSKQQMLQTGNI